MELPKVIFGTSALGNLYAALEDSVKLGIVKECLLNTPGLVVFDSAGKYGAGLALESLGKMLGSLGAEPARLMISNKLGWYRIPLEATEPTFEPGVWKGLSFDAEQRVSYRGIRECFEQGNELLGGYIPQMVSVHDPDEYLAAAKDPREQGMRYADILDAYRALSELRAAGIVSAIGVGAKNWKVIQRITEDIALDWVMIANSMTIMNHPEDLCAFMKKLEDQRIPIINSAVFHSGFLTGSDYYDYRLIQAGNRADDQLLAWRAAFFKICQAHGVQPATACVQFALRAPGVKSIALNTSNPKRVHENISMARAAVPELFWRDMESAGLIRPGFLLLADQ
jgi:D-threo-aldose 1-dehydrogenase